MVDCTVTNLEKTFDIKQKTMVDKLYNMQWLKNTSLSSNPGNIKPICKHIQARDEYNKLEDKDLKTENIEAHSVEEFETGYNSTDTYKMCLPSGAMLESDETVCKDLDSATLLPNSKKLIEKNEGKEDTLTIVESIVTAKLDTQSCTDKEEKDQSNVPQNEAKDITQDAVSNLSNLHEIDQDTQELNLPTRFDDDDNNNSKSIQSYVPKVNDKQKSINCKKADINTKISMEAENKDAQEKGTINALKRDIKNKSNKSLSNEKPFGPDSNSNKSVSSEILDSVNKNKEIYPCNNKHIFTRNRRRIKTKTKNTKSANPVKTDFETKFNKTEMTHQSKNVDENEASKQSMSKLKMQESREKNASMLNSAMDRNKIPGRTGKVTNVSKNSDLLMNESEKRNKKIINKYFQCHQKADSNCNLNRNATLVVNNSTKFTKPMQTKGIPRNIDHAPIYRRNSSCNNYRFDSERIGNVANKSFIKREHTSTNVFSKSNVGTKELCTNDLKNCANQQDEVNRKQSTTDVKSTSLHKINTLPCNNENNPNPVDTRTHLPNDKKSTNLSIDHVQQESILGQYREETTEKMIDKSKADGDQQQHVDVNNKQTNLIKHSSSLLSSDKCTLESQTNATHQHSLKLEFTRHTDNVKVLGNNQTIWTNRLSSGTIPKNATIVNPQQSIPNMYVNVQQAREKTRQQMPSWESNSSKLYNRQFPIISNNTMRLSQIPNTFNAALYESNVQTSNDRNVTSMETTMNRTKEDLNIPYKYTQPNVQQSPVTAFSNFVDHSALSGRTNAWNLPSVQDAFHVDSYNTVQPTTTHIYNRGAFDHDTNTRVMNCSPHPIIYAPSIHSNMQTCHSPQLQPNPISAFYNSPYANYTVIIPNTIPNQPNNFNSIGSMHNQQLKYIPCTQTNNYVRGTHNDLNMNGTVQARNAVDSHIPNKSKHYKMHRDPNSQTIYDLPQYVTSHSHPRLQDVNLMPVTGVNQQYNAYLWQNQKHNQNPMDFMQISKANTSKYLKDQALTCDDNESENIPPIISPKEFL